ncbi:MAG: FAD-dependent oxidoreductase [Dehalococcoidales bacterium]|nr:FAD-dependent oxidoreductase [Dehalococcoidales bacterium]
MKNTTKYSFETPPAPIPASKIKETVKAEVVIIGSGTAGLVCANSAIENGAKVILISASSYPVSRGGSIHAINSKLTRQLGIKYDIGKNFKQEIDRAAGRIDQAKWSLFANKSGEAMDWLIDKMEAAGYKTDLERGVEDPDGIISAFPGSHGFLGGKINTIGRGQPLVVKTLASLAQAAGGKIYYKTVAKQLIREKRNTGRVTAVIAQNAEGEYIKYVGSKAIVLATGDFTRDREMVAKYCPEALPFVKITPLNYNAGRIWGGIYAGDGHKMGLWVGAAWQQIFPNAPLLRGGIGPQTQPYTSFKGLVVNKNAERYSSEDVNSTHAGFLQMNQPERKIFAIWDSDYGQKMAPWYPRQCPHGGLPLKVEDVVAGWEVAVKAGTIFKADTIEELAEKLGLDAGMLQATVDRYNGFCKKGKDEDFFKRPGLLIPVKKGPFYGQTTDKIWLLMVSGGLRTNLKMQVLDTKDKVIPGLYAAGTIIGDMFANYYSFMPSGINLGALCLTFPYLIGKEISMI